MTWEETILKLRRDPAYSQIIFDSYLTADLQDNLNRFRNSEEFQETLKLLQNLPGRKNSLLDLGSGNGISACAFAMEGYTVTAAEPDKSDETGTGAVEKLKNSLGISRLDVVNASGEMLPFDDDRFDIIHTRQCLHHAADLGKFVSECYRVLKKDGYMLNLRDHVIFNDTDKKDFLDSHPFHKFYGGENAYTLAEYTSTLKAAGFKIVKVYTYWESAINHSPHKKHDTKTMETELDFQLNAAFRKKSPNQARFKFLNNLYRQINRLRFGSAKDERRIPGRMYSFISIKN